MEGVLVEGNACITLHDSKRGRACVRAVPIAYPQYLVIPSTCTGHQITRTLTLRRSRRSRLAAAAWSSGWVMKGGGHACAALAVGSGTSLTAETLEDTP